MAEVDDSLFNRAEIAAQRDKEDLLDRLDVLLERYLYTLHEYQKVMQELTKQLSSGYMSLAQANFHNSSSAIRYGRDCYDERMQAIRKVRVFEPGCLKYNRPHFFIQSEERASQGFHVSEADNGAYREDVEGQESMSKHTELGVDASEVRNPPKAPRLFREKTSSDPEVDSTTEQEETEDEEKKGAKSTDPLRWFGILVPPALRTAQTTFVGAVEGPIPQLATIARDMKTQEIEIGQVKKQIKKLL